MVYNGLYLYALSYNQLYRTIARLYLIHWGTKQKKWNGAWDIFWFLMFRTPTYLDECPFGPIRSDFPANYVFLGHFWGTRPNFVIFFQSVCGFYGSQNDRLDYTGSMQKSVWKTEQPSPRYQPKPVFKRRFGLASHVSKHFWWYLRPGCSVFKTDFCDETVRLRQSFWVP